MEKISETSEILLKYATFSGGFLTFLWPKNLSEMKFRNVVGSALKIDITYKPKKYKKNLGRILLGSKIGYH
jgi:hypothetical protein